MNNSIAGVVIIYNPDSDILVNIKSYINQVEYLFLFDNSKTLSHKLAKFVKEHKNVEYIFNGENQGISQPINEAAKLSVRKGFEYLLPMDQDSFAQQNFVNEMLKVFDQFKDVAIVSPWIVDKNYPVKSKIKEPFQVEYCITSGGIIRLDAFLEVGGYNDKLFIDYVDIEFSLRLRKFNYRIIKCPKVNLYHTVGKLKKWSIKPFYFYSTNHSPIRLYYRTRNRFYIWDTFKEEKAFLKNDLIRFIKEIVKIIVVESYKTQKLRMIFRGFRDFKKNNFGRLNDKI